MQTQRVIPFMGRRGSLRWETTENNDDAAVTCAGIGGIFLGSAPAVIVNMSTGHNNITHRN